MACDDGVSLTPINTVHVPHPALWGRYGKVLRSDITGTPGMVTVTFDLSAYSIGDPDSNVLLVDADGVFASGAIEYGGIYDAPTQTVSFPNITLADGDYFTLANGAIQIISTGVTSDWHTTTTWNCNCVPGLGTQVQILGAHTVDINGQNAGVGDLIIDGTLTFLSTDTLVIDENLTNNNTLTSGTGTVSFASTGGAQTIDGTQGFYNLIVNNTSGVSINSGSSTIQGFLDVQSGSFSTNNSVTMLSTSSGSGALKNPASGSIVGDLTVQRYLDEGDSWYLLASPLTDAIIEDWNTEIEMQGFTGTEWPDTPNSSVYYYDETATGPTQYDGYKIPSNTTDVLTNTLGWDIYIATDMYGSVPRMIDLTGTPKLGNGIVISGTYTTNLGDPTADGQSLVGNPYQSPVLVGNLTTAGSYDRSYRKITDGSYKVYQNTDIISPGEGFWLHCQ